MFFRYVNCRVWSVNGHLNKALSKGPLTTTWIWNLHSDAHDFDVQQGSQSLVARKVFSSNIAHLSLVFFWLGGMHLNGAYFSNYSAWLKDPKHSLPSAHNVWPLVGQDILNSDVGGYFQGIYITSGLFQLWRSEGLVTQVHLKYACAASLIGTIISCCGSYYHMHVKWSTVSFYKKFKSLSIHHSAVLFGFGSMSWCGHQVHVSVPLNRLLDSGVDPAVMPCPQDIAFIGPSDYLNPFVSSFEAYGTLFQLNPSTGSVFLGQVAAHHFSVGVVFIMGAAISSVVGIRYRTISEKIFRATAPLANSWHAQLSINLAIAGSLSIAFAHIVYAIPVYPYCASDYPTVLCLFTNHMWIGGKLIVGAGAHASIFMIREANNSCMPNSLQLVLNHRDVIIANLVWVSVALGLHSFGLYIHNDSLQALGRPEDTFSDNSIQLKPVFAAWFVSFDIEVLDGKVVRLAQEFGTADFMVHHIHAFTIHTTLLILLKGVMNARSSRLVNDKLELGFRYPCDGPGRGGTCQISPWDHIYLAVFWMYNSISVVLFHYFWKMQSDVWGVYDVSSQKIMHISAGDFSVNSGTINGWLRDFLWSQAAQVIQSYGTYISGYGLIFIGAHLVWAFSLMFLYSGRGYWQELIESILWAHHKFKIVPYIQPRALSISQGRAVGLTHYILGGIGCTWAFFISRMVALS
uniref:photosystem I n=1 Tax=Alexandrium catenella TaxID=2925 RepID=A0A7S1WVV6_ALECA|mmetsp:Transcript_95984/g.254984  ORF Transcript_95984/g.254984 Transcript_95984/m.254984 type:complete len:687 (+) Transcript_95984:30-2090(+)